MDMSYRFFSPLSSVKFLPAGEMLKAGLKVAWEAQLKGE